ncbi:hypothetical protein LVJ94_32730 [Pendulispora rubella]|uniref:Uncharacterized protein n=1 Tax=Pendulispora rubella TaxID=2741070 RepID=A0ABZ2KSK1_9BACT
MSEEDAATFQSVESLEKELGWTGRMMVDTLRKQGWLAAVERRAADAVERERETREREDLLRHTVSKLERDRVREGRDRQQLREQLERTKAELEQRAQTIAHAAVTRIELEEGIRTAEAAGAKLEAELVEQAGALISIQATLSSRERELEKMRFELTNAKKAMDQQSRERATLQRGLDETTARSAQHLQQKNELQRRLDEANAKALQDKAANDEQLAKVSSMIDVREARISQLERELVQALAAKVPEEAPPNDDERVAALVAELEERDALVAELENALTAQRAAIAKRDTMLAELRTLADEAR